MAGCVTKAHAALVERVRDWDPQAKEGTFLNNIKNALNGFQFGFGIDP